MVVWVLESTTDTYQLSTRVYTLTRGGEKKIQKTCFGIELWLSSFLKIKKKCFSNCRFFASSFMKTAGSFMFLKYPKTNSSLILCFSHTTVVKLTL